MILNRQQLRRAHKKTEAPTLTTYTSCPLTPEFWHRRSLSLAGQPFDLSGRSIIFQRGKHPHLGNDSVCRAIHCLTSRDQVPTSYRKSLDICTIHLFIFTEAPSLTAVVSAVQNDVLSFTSATCVRESARHCVALSIFPINAGAIRRQHNI